MYSEAITGNTDLNALVGRTAKLINTTLLDFGGKEDRDRLRRYLDARSAFYQTYYPHYYATAWQEKRRSYFQVPR